MSRGLGLVVRGLASEEEVADTLKEARTRKVALSARLEHLEGIALALQIDREALRATLQGV